MNKTIFSRKWQEVEHHFRSDINDYTKKIGAISHPPFDRSAQIRMSAKLLSYLARDDKWDRFIYNSEIKKENSLKEFKKMVSHIVGSSDESVDHRRSVAFVSAGAIKELKCKNKGTTIHEHGVPIDIIIRIIVKSKLRSPDKIYDMLEKLMCRVLITKSEAHAIDKQFKSSLPRECKHIPKEYYALMRYHISLRGNLEKKLIPTSTRSQKILEDFCFISDDIESLFFVRKRSFKIIRQFKNKRHFSKNNNQVFLGGNLQKKSLRVKRKFIV